MTKYFFDEREFLVFPYCDCGTYGNLLSRLFEKNFVKVTFSLKKLLKNWFHGKKFRWERILRFPHCALCTVWKLRKFSLTLFWQKFRETNSLTKEITKELVSRKKFSVRENFTFFHTVATSLRRGKNEKFTATQKFRQIDLE